jgi:hypothetical protein
VPLEALSPAAGLLVWEVGLAAACWAPLRNVSSLAERLALLIALDVAAAGLAATVLTFLHANSPGAYLGMAIAGLLVTARRVERPALDCRGWPLAGAVALFSLLLLTVLRPVEEIDSLYNLHYVLGWFRNQTTPFEFAYNYVPFWELTYLPALVIGRTDALLWCQSLKAVTLLGLLLYLLARELELPARLTPAVLAMALAFPHLWTGPSGVATIKNDMIHAAGQAAAALLVVRAARGTGRPSDPVLLALAVIFLSVKFSGPVLIAGGAAVAVAAGVRSLRLAVAVASGWLATVGIYYLRNVLSYGNPFYPFEIRLLFWRLPGRADLSYSSILHNLGDARLWKAFFWPQGGISPAGVLFPGILAAVLAGSVAICLLAFSQWVRRRPVGALPLAMALYQIIVWGVYIRSIYSASGFPGDLAFVLNDLNSLRYVEGALLVAEISLVALLVARRAPLPVVLSLIALHGASRLWLILRREPEIPWLLGAVTAAAIVSLPPRWKLAAPVLLLLAGLWRIEQRRPHWLPQYQPLYLPLYELAPEKIFYRIDDEFSQQPCAHLPVMGRRLQHDVVTGARLPPEAGWIVWLRRQPADPAPAPPPGFSLAVEAPAGALYKSSGR